MKKQIYILLFAGTVLLSGCESWLDREPKDIVTEEQIYNSIGGINSVVSGFYDRLPDWGANYQDPAYYTHFDEGMLGQNVNNILSYAFDYATYYSYPLDQSADADKKRRERAYPYTIIRDLNYHIDQLKKTSVLSDTEKRYYIAEARFLRAYVYFELVKRMGGVPLVTDQFNFDSEIDVTEYQIPRSKEADIYDFIGSEVDDIKEDLNLTPFVQYNRASKGAALAMKCRAMLYAGTLARYNSQMGMPVTLPDGEVGIPASRAEDYFRSCLDAAEEVMKLGYSLYDKNADKSVNFYEALTVSAKAGNNEVIFCKEFADPVLTQNWTYHNLPRTMREGGFGGTAGTFINPSLNLVDAYENIDGSDSKVMPYTHASHADETGDDTQIDANPSSYVYYDSPADIFSGKDPRLAGTILYPGSKFGGKDLDLKAGIAVYNASTGKFSFKTGSYTNYPANDTIRLDGTLFYMTGQDGPSNQTYCTRTGFYVRKYLDETPSADAKKSAIQFIRYRLAEVYLNASEAAYELNIPGKAASYLKTVRDRAGLTTPAAVTLDMIRNERRVELAFEGHRYFDVKRWRVATELFNGNTTNSNAMIYGLWPYQVHRPGDATDGKWIYVRRIPAEFKYPRKFVWGNYYSEFPKDALATNPALVKNPGH